MSFRLLHKLFLLLSLGIPSLSLAQSAETEDDISTCAVQIDMGKAYVGGLCIIKGNESLVNASLVNEFGVSIVTFRYEPDKDRIKVVSIIKQFSSPVVKKILKKDFKIILTKYQLQGNSKRFPIQYINSKHNITYNLIPL